MEQARRATPPRSPPLARLNAWRKRSPLSPYWLDWRSLRATIERLAPSARGLLLDVGCSERPYGAIFAPHVRRYVGLDYPPALLAKQPELWAILDRARRSVDVFGDGRRLPFADASFDTVLSTEVLEHVMEPGALVEEMARVLKPGGRLLITVPFVQPLHERPSDFFRYTPFALRGLVEQSGLEAERIEARGNYASAMGALAAQFLLRILGARTRQPDGSVRLSPWKSVVVLPVIGLVQIAFHLLSKCTSDDALALGYSVIARKPVRPRRKAGPNPRVGARIQRCQPDRSAGTSPQPLPR